MKKVLLLNAGTSFGGLEKIEFESVKHINDNIIETNMLVLDKNSLKNCPEAVENSHVYDLGITKLTRKTEWIFNYRYSPEQWCLRVEDSPKYSQLSFFVFAATSSRPSRRMLDIVRLVVSVSSCNRSRSSFVSFTLTP